MKETMKSKRMTATLLSALLLSASYVTEAMPAPAFAAPPAPVAEQTTAPVAEQTTAPVVGQTAPATPSVGQTAPATPSVGQPTQPTPAPSVEPTAPTLPAAEQTGGAPTSIHTFETPLPEGKKGAAPRTLSTQAYSMARTGAIKVRLVTVQLTDVKASIPMGSAVAAVQATSAYWQKMSDNRLSISVTSTETLNSRSASSGQRYFDLMNTITNELGWVDNPYTALVVFVSSPTLSDGAYGAGWSYHSGTSGRVLMPLPAPLTTSVLTHEFGHVLGLGHADSLECGSGAQDVATRSDGTFADSTCSVREYGDSMDLMGVSQNTQPTISSTLWEFGGFGTGREIRDVGKAGSGTSYTLTAWAGTADNRAVKFTDPVSGETYYLELRLPVGYDAATAVASNRGVKIVQRFGAGSLVLMPDSRRFSGYYSARHAWQAGQTFTTHAGTRVSINWISDSAAGVTIESMSGVAGKAIGGLVSSMPSLGAQTSGVICGLRNGGCFQGFAGGAVMWSPGSGAQPSLAGPIRDAWAGSGYENGVMGYPTSGVICGLKNGGCFQNFQGGAVMWSPSSGAAFSTFGAIRDFWQQQNFENGSLGYPTSNAFCGLKNGGCFQNYQGGTVMWSPATGAQTVLPGPVQQVWQRNAFENGTLGYPTGKQECNAAATWCTQAFQGGTAAWSSASGGWALPGVTAASWRPADVGYPVGAQICGLRAGGCFQNFQKGVIMHAPAFGAFPLTGSMLREWQQSGFENGSLGYPTSGQICQLKNDGCFQNFENASILSSPATGTHPVYLGPFLSTWSGSGFENGILGYPVSHQFCGIKNSGCFQNFEGGTIMWSPATGAQPVTSAPVRTAWGKTGYENGSLGYPSGRIICGLKNAGCFQNFEKGSIMWSPATGAHPTVLGPIQAAWGQQGFENGPLGYPTGTQTCTTGNTSCTQTFQGGKLNWTPLGGIRTERG
jgi:uncharacterized protein with LGFP repeats